MERVLILIIKLVFDFFVVLILILIGIAFDINNFIIKIKYIIFDNSYYFICVFYIIIIYNITFNIIKKYYKNSKIIISKL